MLSRAALVGVVVVTSACFDVGNVDPETNDVELVPNENGWIFRHPEVHVQGAWYPYGDRYGDEKCTKVGMHPEDDCSLIVSPDPDDGKGFLNERGRMCTMGQSALVKACMPGVECSERDDFANMWGAGIGLDLNKPNDAPDSPKQPWNPDDYGVLGISFELESFDEDGSAPVLRVEFPIALPDGSGSDTTEGHPRGSPYWGATTDYDNSPVRNGYNRLLWPAVASPVEDYAFDRTQLLAIQFHVPSARPDELAPRPFHFCISRLTLLRE